MPSFQQVQLAVNDAYKKSPRDVEKYGCRSHEVASQRDLLGIGGLASDLTRNILDAAYEKMAASFDEQHGGFEGAPKFPQPMNLDFLLRTYARTAKTMR